MDWSNVFIWAQVIGLAAMLCNILTWQLKNPRHIILSHLPVCSLWGIQFALLGAPLGVVMNTCAIFKYSSLFFIRNTFVPYVIGIHLLLIGTLGIYFFEAWFDSLPLIATAISSLAFLYRDNRPLIARACVVAQISWIIYSIIVGSWMSAICSSLIIVSSVSGMYRHENWNLNKSPINLFKSLFILPPSTVKEAAHV